MFDDDYDDINDDDGMVMMMTIISREGWMLNMLLCVMFMLCGWLMAVYYVYMYTW